MNYANKLLPTGNTRAAHRAPSRFVFLFLFIAAGLLLRDCGLYAQTELGSEDDLTVLGTNGSADDPDVEIKGFTVFGSTQAVYTGAAAGPGNVVVNGALSVSSGAYFVGDSTFTNATKIFINDGSPGQVLRKNAAGYLDWDSASALGDNLGSHDAAQRLNMGNFAVWSSSAITAARYQINGSTVLAVLTGGSLGVGVGAGRINTSGNNAFVGPYAGYSNTSGGNNSFLGNYAGYSNTSGGNNSFLGNYAGYGNTTGGSNSFVGNYAGRYNTTGWGNSFVGDYAGYKNTTGETNSIVGNSAGYYNEAGSANAILGSQAGYSGPFSSSTLVGYKAGYQLNAGSGGNTLIGYQAGFNVVSGTGNIIIGYDKRAPTAGTNNYLNIGDVLYGDLSAKTIGISTRAPQAALDIVSTGTTVNEYAQIWRGSDGVVRASMTATGKLFADISGSLGGGDNLGNHTATQDLNMQASQLTGTGALTMSSITATGPLGVWAARLLLESDIVISSYTSAVYGEGVYAGPLLFTPGLAITSYGEMHTMGVGRGSVAGAVRGPGAVDLQVNRGITTQVASGGYAVIGGGQQNTAAGLYSVVPGGSQNTAGNQYSAVGGGVGNNASGDRAVVPGGDTNLAGGLASFAAGSYAKANAAGAFTWADSQGVAVDNAVADRAVFKTRGGFMITGSTDTVLSGNTNRGMLVTGNGLVGISTGAPQAALDVVATGTAADIYAQVWRNSAGTIVSSMSATGVMMAAKFIGDGSEITGVTGATDNTKVLKAGDTMTGQLTLSGSTLTVIAPTSVSSSLWVSTSAATAHLYVSTTGNVGIGTNGPSSRLEVQNSQSDTTDNYMLTVANRGTPTGQMKAGIDFVVGNGAAGAKISAINNGAVGGDLAVVTRAGDVDTERMRVLAANGNVGIGTATPAAKLHLQHTEFPQMRIHNDNASAPSGETGIRFRTQGTEGVAHADIGWTGTGADAGNLVFRVPYSSERMRIQSDGSVGIGTVSPITALSVSRTGGTTTLAGRYLQLGLTENLGNGQIWGMGFGFTTTSTEESPAFMGYIQTSNTANTKGDIFFGARDTTGATDAPTERMRITSGGNVGVGMTNPGYKLDVAGTINAQEMRVNGVVLNPGTGSNWTVSGADVYRNGGKVGIGTTAPGAKLDLRGTGDLLRIAYDDGGISKRIDVNATSGSNTLQYVSNDLNFWDSTLPRVTFKQGGYVGIGTTTPAGLLNIKGVSGTGQLIIDNPAPNVNSQIMFRSNGVDMVSAGTNQSVGDDNNFEIYSRKSGQTKSLMFMNLTTGNVGIGTTTPAKRLDVYTDGASEFAAMITNDGNSNNRFGVHIQAGQDVISDNNYFIRTSDGDGTGVGFLKANAGVFEVVGQSGFALGLGANGIAGDDLYINTSGNVGIGTTGPGAKLHAVETSGSSSYIFVASTATDPGAYKMVVSTAGRIGVGTPAPEQKMHVFSDATIGETAPSLQVETTHPSNYAIRYLTKYGSTGLDTILPAGTGSSYGVMVSGGDQSVGGGGIVLKTDGNNPRMFIRKDGNVGIGTTNPGARFEVAGGSATIRGSDSNSTIAGFADAGGNYRMVISTNGNVGIGTATPSKRLTFYESVAAATQEIRMDGVANTVHRLAWDLGNKYLEYSQATGKIALVNASNADFVLNNVGNVGIGTTNPGYKLDVNGDANLAAGSVYRIGGVAQSGSSKWTTGTGDDIYRSLGNVGIGTTGPTSPLHVYGNSANPALYVQQAGAGAKFQVGNTADIYVSNANNVGIGTVTPQEKLQVSGGIMVSSGIAANSWIVGGCTNPGDAGDIMVPVGDLCVDKYEASAWSTATGGTQYGASSDNYPCSDNGQDCGTAGTKIYARSAVSVTPSRFMTWFQAAAACKNAGKHLLTNAEWQTAAAGTPDPGATGTAPNCNVSGGGPTTTGAGTSCLSSDGVENMIGSLWEWVADWGQYGPNNTSTNGEYSNTAWSAGAGYGNDATWNVSGAAYTNEGGRDAYIPALPTAVVRGGRLGLGANAGVFAFDASYAPSSWDGAVGFRCGRRR